MITGNLTQLSEQDGKRVLAERTATYWLHQKRKGCMSREDIVKRLNAMAPEDAQLHREALNKFRHKMAA